MGISGAWADPYFVRKLNMNLALVVVVIQSEPKMFTGDPMLCIQNACGTV